MKNILFVFLFVVSCGSMEPYEKPKNNCSLCSQCGGEWFYWAGAIPSEEVVERGQQCSGEYTRTRNSKTSLCCKDVANPYHPMLAHYFGLNNFSDDFNNGIIFVKNDRVEVLDNSYALFDKIVIYNRPIELKNHFVYLDKIDLSLDCILYFPNINECEVGYNFSGQWLLKDDTEVFAYGLGGMQSRIINKNSTSEDRKLNLCCR